VLLAGGARQCPPRFSVNHPRSQRSRPASTAFALRIFQVEADFHRHLEAPNAPSAGATKDSTSPRPEVRRNAVHMAAYNIQTEPCWENPCDLATSRFVAIPEPRGLARSLNVGSIEMDRVRLPGSSGRLAPATVLGRSEEHAVSRPRELLMGAVAAIRERLSVLGGQSERTILLGTVLLASAVSIVTRFVVTQYLATDVTSALLDEPYDCLPGDVQVGRHCFGDYALPKHDGMMANPWSPTCSRRAPRHITTTTRRRRWCRRPSWVSG